MAAVSGNNFGNTLDARDGVTNGDDTIRGWGGDYHIYGWGGDDEIWGGMPAVGDWVVAFDDPYEKSFRANVTGTLNALAFSQRLQEDAESPFVAHLGI